MDLAINRKDLQLSTNSTKQVKMSVTCEQSVLKIDHRLKSVYLEHHGIMTSPELEKQSGLHATS